MLTVRGNAIASHFWAHLYASSASFQPMGWPTLQFPIFRVPKRGQEQESLRGIKAADAAKFP
jgi:hypothetical protein